MSFKSDTTFKGITINQAFYNINAVGGTKENAVIELHCYATEELYEQDKANNTTENKLYADTSLNFVPSVDDSSKNWIAQAYQSTQVLEKYPNKINC